jgi:hypothetical protein
LRLVFDFDDFEIIVIIKIVIVCRAWASRGIVFGVVPCINDAPFAVGLDVYLFR